MRYGPGWTTHVAGQLRLALALAVGLDRGPFRSLAVALAGNPRIEDSLVAGVPATVARPGRGRGPWPAVVVVPGITRLGRRHPALVGVARGLAGCGLLTIVVDPAGLAAGELTLASLQQVRAAAEAVAVGDDCRDGRVALAGVSGGATLALLAAAEPSLGHRVSVVAALAPCCDVVEGLRIATTGRYRSGRALVPFETGDFFRLTLARSAVAWLPEGADRDALAAHLRALEDYGAEPLAGIRSWPPLELGDEARALVALLANEDSDRFEELYGALPEPARRIADVLSPLRVAGAVRAPVEVVVGRRDKYLPLADATSFTSACPTARLTVVDSLAHAVPRFALRDARDAARLDAAAARILGRAVAPSYSRR